MSDPARHRGRVVQFRARVYSDWEGRTLFDESCREWMQFSVQEELAGLQANRQRNGLPVDSRTAVPFGTLHQYLSEFYHETVNPHGDSPICAVAPCPKFKVSATVIGRFEWYGGDAPKEVAYHMRGWWSRLLVQSVSEFSATAIDRSMYSGTSATPEHLRQLGVFSTPAR